MLQQSANEQAKRIDNRRHNDDAEQMQIKEETVDIVGEIIARQRLRYRGIHRYGGSAPPHHALPTTAMPPVDAVEITGREQYYKYDG